MEESSTFTIADLDDFTVALLKISLNNRILDMPESEPCQRLAAIFDHEFDRRRGNALPAEVERIEDIEFLSYDHDDLWPIIVAVSCVRVSCHLNPRLSQKAIEETKRFLERILESVRDS